MKFSLKKASRLFFGSEKHFIYHKVKIQTVIGRETTRSKERPEGSTWKSSLYWTLMMLQGPNKDQIVQDSDKVQINLIDKVYPLIPNKL